MTYLTVKYIKGNPYLYEVRSERTGDRVRQVFVRYLGRADTAEGMERQATYSGGEAVSVEPRKVAVPAVTKPVAVTPEVKEPEIISTPEIAKDYIIKKEPEPLLPSGFKYMVYQSDDTPMYISGATPEEAESKLKQGHKVASVKLESELEVTPTPEVTSIQQGIQDAVAEHTYRLEHAVSGKTTGYTGFWITKQGKIYQHDLLKDIPASEREGLVNIHSHSPIGWQQRLEEGRLDAFDPLGAGDVENLQTNVKNRWSDTMGVIMGDGRMEFLRVPDNAKTTFLRLSKAEIRKALSPTSTEGMRNALIQFAEENGLEYQTGLSWKGEPALPKAEVTPLITEKVTPEVTSTDISSEKFAVIQEALSELRGKGFVPTVTSFSIDPTIEETVRGEYSGETKSIAFRSEGGITPFLVEHELLHSIIAEARASKGNDFLVDYAKVAGFTGKGLEESITTEATIRIPVVEDLVRNMQVYLRHPEELPGSVRAFYDNLAETLAKPPVPKAEAIPEAPVTPEVTKELPVTQIRTDLVNELTRRMKANERLPVGVTGTKSIQNYVDSMSDSNARDWHSVAIKTPAIPKAEVTPTPTPEEPERVKPELTTTEVKFSRPSTGSKGGFAIMDYKTTAPINDPVARDQIINAYNKVKSPIGYATYNSIHKETKLPYETILGVLKQEHINDPHNIHFNVDRMGKNIYFKYDVKQPLAQPERVKPEPTTTKKETGELIAKNVERKISSQTGEDTDFITEYRLVKAPEDAPAEWMGNPWGVIRILTVGGEERERALLETGSTPEQTVKLLPWESSYKTAEKHGIAKQIYDKKIAEQKAIEDKKEQEQKTELEDSARFHTVYAPLRSSKGATSTTIQMLQFEIDKPNIKISKEGYDVGNGVGVVIHGEGKYKTYTVTHLNTGLAMGHEWKDRLKAIALAKAEAKIDDWSQYETEKDVPKETMDTAAALVRAFTSETMDTKLASRLAKEEG